MSIEPACCKSASQSPAERRHMRVRNSIIAAAEKMFAREGELAVSMRRLAEETDYSPAALYKYFGSKADVFNAVRESFFERLVGRIDLATKDQTDAVSTCRTTARAYIETALENPGTYLMAYSSWADHLPEDVGSFGSQAAAQLQALIANGVASGEFRQQDISLAGKSIWAAVHGLTSLLIQIDDFRTGVDGTETHSNEKVIEFHIEFMINGLLATK
ncbi:Transcriptional regulator, AcrR family [hydrothermal vent metagenome]|uniref:Transcriptional regulator, AcrR family n=1 Tax=hydrothermal vent metagenome TaxID=652676 RepID=A0A3B0RIS0_9ZZZZ